MDTNIFAFNIFFTASDEGTCSVFKMVITQVAKGLRKTCFERLVLYHDNKDLDYLVNFLFQVSNYK